MINLPYPSNALLAADPASLLLNQKLSSEIIPVDDDAATGGDGVAWASAYRHLQTP